jgi:hypothetical protein
VAVATSKGVHLTVELNKKTVLKSAKVSDGIRQDLRVPQILEERIKIKQEILKQRRLHNQAQTA